jgi:hypothetical protein|tara:strand:- start:2425 stop:2613 length:189 start_codon:yes stop_codon:yes gene_type:complete
MKYKLQTTDKKEMFWFTTSPLSKINPRPSRSLFRGSSYFREDHQGAQRPYETLSKGRTTILK